MLRFRQVHGILWFGLYRFLACIVWFRQVLFSQFALDMFSAFTVRLDRFSVSRIGLDMFSAFRVQFRQVSLYLLVKYYIVSSHFFCYFNRDRAISKMTGFILSSSVFLHRIAFVNSIVVIRGHFTNK